MLVVIQDNCTVSAFDNQKKCVLQVKCFYNGQIKEVVMNENEEVMRKVKCLLLQLKELIPMLATDTSISKFVIDIDKK